MKWMFSHGQSYWIGISFCSQTFVDQSSGIYLPHLLILQRFLRLDIYEKLYIIPYQNDLDFRLQQKIYCILILYKKNTQILSYLNVSLRWNCMSFVIEYSFIRSWKHIPPHFFPNITNLNFFFLAFFILYASIRALLPMSQNDIPFIKLEIAIKVIAISRNISIHLSVPFRQKYLNSFSFSSE